MTDFSERLPNKILRTTNKALPHLWCLHLVVVVGFECPWHPESYAGGSVATDTVTHAGQVKG
jgi:hypothetical protein